MQIVRQVTALVILACGATTAPAQARAVPVVDGTVKGEVAAKLDKRLAELAEKDFSGVILVVHDGVVVLAKGYGFADRAGKVPFTTDTVFSIGSITKQFTASAILKLEMEGKPGGLKDSRCPV